MAEQAARVVREAAQSTIGAAVEAARETAREVIRAADDATRTARDDLRHAVDVARRASAMWDRHSGFHERGIRARAQAARARSRTTTNTRRRRKRTSAPPGGSGDPPPATAALAGREGGLWHDDDDRADVVAALTHDFAVFEADVGPVATADGASPATRQWWDVEIAPELKEWRQFAVRVMASWVTRTAVDWSTYQGWIDRLRQARSAARAHGIALSTPEPANAPRTLFERGGGGDGTPADTILTFGRVTLYAVLGLGGLLSARGLLSGGSGMADDVESD